MPHERIFLKHNFSLKFQQQKDKKWVNVEYNENENISNVWLNSQINVLTFNVRNLLGLIRRSNFANCLAIENNLDILTLTETWLTNDKPDESLFLNDYTIYRNDRTTENNKFYDGGVLIAVKSMPPERIFLDTKSEYVAR